MTVAELIEELKAHPQDALVECEGGGYESEAADADRTSFRVRMDSHFDRACDEEPWLTSNGREFKRRPSDGYHFHRRAVVTIA